MSDDWRRQLEAKRKALQRRRHRRRGVADGGATYERHKNGDSQTDSNFEQVHSNQIDYEMNEIELNEFAGQLLQRANDAEQTDDMVGEDHGQSSRKAETNEQATQVAWYDIPDAEKNLQPALESLVNNTIEQVNVKILKIFKNWYFSSMKNLNFNQRILKRSNHS